MPNIIQTILPEDVGKPKTGSTQEHLPIMAIHDDVVILKDGSASIILQTTAVNFDLLSENEQLAIISSFAQLLNSLSFPIQIVVRSKRLDITHYLETIKKIEVAQTNPLLKDLTRKYRVFVETLTSENQVLDKQFYVVISVSYLEIGIMNNIERDIKKAITVLTPRRDHIIKQLARIGLKATSLDTQKLVGLIYDYYNETTSQIDIQAFIDRSISLKTPNPNASPTPPKMPEPPKTPEVKIVDKMPPVPPAPNPQINPHYMETRTSEVEEIEAHTPIQPPVVENIANPVSTSMPDIVSSSTQAFYRSDRKQSFSPNKTRPTSPFVVEELKDE